MKTGSLGDRTDALDRIEVVIQESTTGVLVKTIHHRKWGSSNGRVSYAIKVPRDADLRIRTTNGRVITDGVNGNHGLRSVNGSISAERMAGSMKTRTTNGSIDIELTRLNANEDINLKTVNGSIVLSLPEATTADLDVTTANGRIRSDLPVTIGTASKRKLHGTLNGGGDTRVRVSTVNGSISLRGVSRGSSIDGRDTHFGIQQARIPRTGRCR